MLHLIPLPNSRQPKGSIEIQGLEKVSPPFKGGVAQQSGAGVVDLFVSFYLYIYEKQKPLHQKGS